MTYLSTKKTEGGFTLVELAIVLIIVGLLIGGILKGQELIQNARVTATVSQIKGFEAASNTFRDSFGTLPGDLPQAGNRLANCTNNCVAGVGATNGDQRVVQDPGLTLAGEGLSVFPQLSAADLISGVDPTAANNVIGESTPATELGGSGFSMGFVAGVAGATTLVGPQIQPGHYVGIIADPAADTAGDSGLLMLPKDTSKMDNKIDDGLPNQGTVLLAGDGDCATDATTAAVYSNITTPDCTVFVRIQ